MWDVTGEKARNYIVFEFLLTHPVWDVTLLQGLFEVQLLFLLTHPVWDVTSFTGFSFNPKTISTHTSRVGCDLHQPKPPQHQQISTHTSRVGCDKYLSCYRVNNRNFYSHIPCGMWLNAIAFAVLTVNFYSHIPCGMWPVTFHSNSTCCKFLLTHPVWDVTSFEKTSHSWNKFLLTHPVWDVTEELLLHQTFQ